MDLVQGAQAFQILAQHLKETGEGGLRRDLNKAIRDAAQPIADEIGGLANLEDHMPNRYAAVLKADLRVTTSARAGAGGGITITARAPTLGRGGRAVRQRDDGVLGHPVFGRRSKANPRRWASWEYQTGGMSPGFFTGPAEAAAPQVRDKVLRAMSDTCDKITRKA